jgi:hypothetical protein
MRVRGTGLWPGLSLAAVVAFAPCRGAAQDTGSENASSADDDPVTAKGRLLRKAVKEGEKALLEGAERLQRDAGLKKDPKDGKGPGKSDDRSASEPARDDWTTCGDKNCPKCSKKEFCLRRVERVRDTCQKIIGNEEDIKKRFVRLRINYDKLKEFLQAQAKRLADQAKQPPDSDQIPESERDRLKNDYGDMSKQVAGLVPVYQQKFEAVGKTEASIVAKLALLKSKTGLINDMIEAVKGSENIDGMEREIKDLEKSLQEVHAAVDGALEAFANLATTLRIEK